MNLPHRYGFIRKSVGFLNFSLKTPALRWENEEHAILKLRKIQVPNSKLAWELDWRLMFETSLAFGVWRLAFRSLLAGLLALCGGLTIFGAPASLPTQPESSIKTFPVKGVVKELPANGKTVVISHEAIPGYMDAMTMPFNVKNPKDLADLRVGETIAFRLFVGDTESWIDQISHTANSPALEKQATVTAAPADAAARPRHPLLDYKFTNELGQAVSLNDFKGQALGITFFFTRCPIPEFCPRLSKNFQQASEKLLAMTNAPSNWHFLSFSFDPAFDTPTVLKAYAERYQYDSNHWSFLTGPTNQIAELAAESDVKIERDGSFYNHNFRTLVVDASGHLQMVFPIGGDLSDALVAEMLKAATATNKTARHE